MQGELKTVGDGKKLVRWAEFVINQTVKSSDAIKPALCVCDLCALLLGQGYERIPEAREGLNEFARAPGKQIVEMLGTLNDN
ncbi:hypothetical protein Ciccas_005774 [Cichlidogyrus casuarinus]|uniref:Uncharacterized protein n=1 Tax=Cichlidogyrus casuarinus TaxID=1844966 RepID=A0ABD2Q7P9_9PLAT